MVVPRPDKRYQIHREHHSQGKMLTMKGKTKTFKRQYKRLFYDFTIGKDIIEKTQKVH